MVKIVLPVQPDLPYQIVPMERTPRCHPASRRTDGLGSVEYQGS
jgi:hypothetical protein